MPTPTSTAPPPVDRTPVLVTPNSGHRADADRPLRIASVVAGSGLALLTLLAVFGNFLVLQRLVTPGTRPRP